MMGLFLALSYSLYVVASALICRIIGKKRFYIVRYRVAELDFFRSRYGAWVGKSFTVLSSVGFFYLMIKTAFFEVSDAIAYLANDWTEIPYFMTMFLMLSLAATFYCFIARIIKSAELKFCYPKKLNFNVPGEVQGDKVILDAWSIRRVIRLARKAMSPIKGAAWDTELDVPNITDRVELERTKRKASSFSDFSPEVWLQGRLRKARQNMRSYFMSKFSAATVGSLAIKSTPAEEVFLQERPLPIIDLKPEAQKKTDEDEQRQLELQLESLPEADRELVRKYIICKPELVACIISAENDVRFKFVEDGCGRRIVGHGVIVRKRRK